MIELILLCCFSLQPEIQTVYNFDIYSGEQVKPSPLTQKILDNRKKSTYDYTAGPTYTPDFFIVSQLPIFDEDFKITYYSYDAHYGYKAEAEFGPYTNIYIAQYLRSR